MKRSKAMKWIKNLLSGKFTQAEGALMTSDDDSDPVVGHCCLGVLGRTYKIPKYKLLGTELLDPTMQKLCGIASEDGQPRRPDGQLIGGSIKFRVKNPATGKRETQRFDSLAQANDKGISFKRIARWIEKNYKYL